jgi:hypothetical protein
MPVNDLASYVCQALDCEDLVVADQCWLMYITLSSLNDADDQNDPDLIPFPAWKQAWSYSPSLLRLS